MDTSLSPQKAKLLVTTSWDDGDVLDARLAELLERYGVKGTFYIAKTCRPERLSEAQIRDLARFHEVGAHSLTHPDLRAISDEQKFEEASGSKQWLEGVLGSEVPLFCYPRGYYDEAVIAAVRRAGFAGARTTQGGNTARPAKPFEMGTTLQIYPFPFRKLDRTHYYWGKLLEPLRQRAPQFVALGVPRYALYSWQAAARAAFDAAREKGGVFHLWGHSWELEKYGLWGELERFLQYVADREDCAYVTNGALLQ